MTDVFISYSQRAPAPTAALAAALVERGYAPTYDVNLLPGDVFGAVIDEQIDAAKAVITIWSLPALKSTWVPAESQRAHDKKKLISVRTEDVDPTALPTPFNATHAPLHTAIDDIVAKLIKLGAHPSGAAETDLAPEDVLARRAARDWRDHICTCEVVAEIEVYRDTYRTLPMYRRLAESRLENLRVRAPNAAPAAPPRIVRPEDVVLRLDPGMHTTSIKRIAITADERMLATCSDDKTVRLWALPEGNLIRTLRPQIDEGNQGKVYSVALDPAGRWAAAAGWLSTPDLGECVLIFDTATGAVTARLGALPEIVNDLAVSADGRRLAAGLGGGHGIRVWSLNDGVWSEPFEDREYGGEVYGVAFAPDGKLVTTSYDGSLRLYGPDMSLLRRGGASGARPYGVAFDRDAKRLAVGYDDLVNVGVLDAAELTPLYAADVSGIAGNLMSVAWLADGKLTAGGTHRTETTPIFAWQDGGRGARATWPGGSQTIRDMAPLSGGGLVFASGDPGFGMLSSDGVQTLWRGPATADFRGKRYEHFLVSPDGKRLRFGLREFSAEPYLFDLGARTLAPSPRAPRDVVQADIKRLKIENWVNNLAPSFKRERMFRAPESIPLSHRQYETCRGLAIAPDGKSFVVGMEWSLQRFDAAGKRLWDKPVPSIAWGVHLARKGRLVLAAYADGTIRWHRASDGAELLALFIHIPPDPDAEKQWIVFTPKGYYDCSPGADSLIGWHINRGPDQAADFYPAETFASTFKQPALVDAALKGV